MKKSLYLCCTLFLLLCSTSLCLPHPFGRIKEYPNVCLPHPRMPASNAGPAAIQQWTEGRSEEISPQKLDFPPVGIITLYGNTRQPDPFVIFLSGDGGWNKGVIDMAESLAADGHTLVAGVDLVKYYKNLQALSKAHCLYPAGDMENLSQFVQKQLRLPSYEKPLLIGYSSGATLTYGLLCQAPSGTFRGGVVLGFCPDIQLKNPLCTGSGHLTMKRRTDGKGYDLSPLVAPSAPLEVLQGEIDQDCLCEQTCAFFDHTEHVHVVRLPQVGHGFSVTRNWLPQFRQAVTAVCQTTRPPSCATAPKPKTNMGLTGPLPSTPASPTEGNAAELPMVYTPASTLDPALPFAFFLSGDGGWTGFDQQISDQLATRGVSVAGLNCQSYFWQKKTPEQTAADLAPVLRQCLHDWKKEKFSLVGYSFGANVAPFVLNRLPEDLRKKCQSLILLSPDPYGDFEIHVAAMLGKSVGHYDVAAEIRGLKTPPVCIIRGMQEGTEMQQALSHTAQTLRFEQLPGSHHYDNDAHRVADAVHTCLKS